MTKLEKDPFGMGNYYTVGYFTTRKKAETYCRTWERKNNYYPAWRLSNENPPKIVINPEA